MGPQLMWTGVLSASFCGALQALPTNIGDLRGITTLQLDNCRLASVPAALGGLSVRGER